MTQVAAIRPTRQDFALYDDGFAWSFELRVAALGDLTGATINANFKPTVGTTGPTALTITTTPAGLLDSRFTLGYSVPVAGKHDIQIIRSGAGRTYIYGDIALQADFA